MHLSDQHHLTYCTNIHPGETWPEVFRSLDYALAVRDNLHWSHPMGIGLRLSAKAAQQLAQPAAMETFRSWLSTHRAYVFTLNGFPYGQFHGKRVKDQVHAPDWTARKRVEYTRQLFEVLDQLLPQGVSEGGVSTSPLSYRFWYPNAADRKAVRQQGARHLAEITAQLARHKSERGKTLHLDIEPEPDGLLENSTEFLDFYQNDLLTEGARWLQRETGVSRSEAETQLRTHIQLCYDVCHFAVEYEDDPAAVLRKLHALGVQTGKIQISAALRTDLKDHQGAQLMALQPFHESTYLHQTVCRKTNGQLKKFPDLGPALEALPKADYTELRTHFHVPIFTDNYGALQSTRSHIEDVLKLWRKQPFSPHLEVETYTWEVLPQAYQLPLTESIARELAWVLQILQP